MENFGLNVSIKIAFNQLRNIHTSLNVISPGVMESRLFVSMILAHSRIWLTALKTTIGKIIVFTNPFSLRCFQCPRANDSKCFHTREAEKKIPHFYQREQESVHPLETLDIESADTDFPQVPNIISKRTYPGFFNLF